MLLDSYIQQEARVTWNECESSYWSKAGCVLSPSLFNLYIDKS